MSDWAINMSYIRKLYLLSSLFEVSHFIISINPKNSMTVLHPSLYDGQNVIACMGRVFFEAFLFRSACIVWLRREMDVVDDGLLSLLRNIDQLDRGVCWV